MPISPNYNPYNFAAAQGQFNEDGSFTYPDGTTASLEEVNAERAKRGMPPVDPTEKSSGRGWSTVGVTDPFGNLHAEQRMFGAETPMLSANSPGGTLDTSKADNERARTTALLGKLQQQAATGGGAWEGALKGATDQARSGAMALGQSMPGVGYASSLRNIGNAQGAVDQRAVGQGNILRAQSKQDATDQMAALLSGQGTQDISQAAGAADVAGGVRGQNVNANLQNEQNMQDLIKRNTQREEAAWKGIGNAATLGAASLSDGGKVPGRAEVFGDDSRNDTVPAKLSPGEIVIPRSHAGSPEAAADFVRSLHASRGGPQPGVQHLAPGGEVGPAVGIGKYETPSIQNGGLLNTRPFEQTRNSTSALLDQLTANAGAGGPSVAPQQTQNAMDANFAQALQARSGGRGIPAGDLLQVTSAANQGAAGSGAAQVAGEQSRAQEALAKGALGARDREFTLARAQQAGAWRNTLLNTGLTTEQAAMQQRAAQDNSDRTQRYISGAGQGLAAYAAASGRDDSDSNDFAGRGSASDLGRDKFAKGGEVRARRPVPARAPRRDPKVEVEALEPTWLQRSPEQYPGPIGPERPMRLKDGDPDPFPDDEFIAQRAHGGEIPEDEGKRARAFVAALRRRSA